MSSAAVDSTAGMGGRGVLQYDRQFQRDVIKLHPGDYAASGLDLMLTTVLGSCVAACLYDPVARIGGMNHFLLPGSDKDASSGRYGMYAMELLINDMLRRGALRQRLVAKVFGGARVLGQGSIMEIGERNARFIEEYLHDESIPILGSDLRSDKARRVILFTHTGQALVRAVGETRDHADWQEELRYAREAGQKTQVAGGVELF